MKICYLVFLWVITLFAKNQSHDTGGFGRKKIQNFREFIDSSPIIQVIQNHFSFPSPLIKNILLADEPFKKAVEISGITTYKDSFYLAAEKCKKIFVLDKKNFKVRRIINLDTGFLKGNNIPVGIEGITVFKNHLFLTDEESARVYDYNIAKNSIHLINTGDYLKDDHGSFGIEGIAVNKKNNVCYVLKEKNAQYQSEIGQFKISEKGDSIIFTFVKNLLIQHPVDNSDPARNWRYSDVYFDEGNSYLYCLKSYFVEPGTSSNKYQIDTIKVGKSGLISGDLIGNAKYKLFADISDSVNSYYRRGYNTNLEGMTILKNDLYLISDNSQSATAGCDSVGEGKTLLLKLTPVYKPPKIESFKVDSLFFELAKNSHVKNILKDARNIYEAASIDPNNICFNAFQAAYLEKTIIDSGYIKIDPALSKFYTKKDILTIVDFTKKGDKKRFLVVDLRNKSILYNTLVSHGSASGKGIDSLKRFYKYQEVNGKESIPYFFGNIDTSYRSSLGMMVTLNDSYPGELCHLCKYFLDSVHKCGVEITGLEKEINNNVKARDIVFHTTGSKDYSDTVSMLRILTLIEQKKYPKFYRIKDSCYCFKSGETKPTLAYASQTVIKKAHGFIGTSLGCLALPEEDHIPIMETIKNGSLVFDYSNAISPTSTNYFIESPIIKQIITYAQGRGDGND